MNADQILSCSHEDFLQIISEIEDFWGSDRTRAYHHPMFVNEFGDTAFVIKQNDKVMAYLFGFISQKERLGYVHLIGVRQHLQKNGMGRRLYSHFIERLKLRGIFELKAITTPTNEKSIEFHSRLGMTMVGEENEKGMKVVKDYSGIGEHRVVFKMQLHK
jgi:N-acetylglutamate synthase-like GNAT family acetyltransferase